MPREPRARLSLGPASARLAAYSPKPKRTNPEPPRRRSPASHPVASLGSRRRERLGRSLATLARQSLPRQERAVPEWAGSAQVHAPVKGFIKADTHLWLGQPTSSGSD
jgi:hypothetical protein